MNRIYIISISLIFIIQAYANQPEYDKIQGWNMLSDSYEDTLVTIAAAKDYNVNHLQLSHNIVMDLREVREKKKQLLVNDLTEKTHDVGIKEVIIWDHALYSLNYYPEKFKTEPNGATDLYNPEFWVWFKKDYREMLDLIPKTDGLVLTFIETGARAENQFSRLLMTAPEKLAAVVDAVCKEYNKKPYIRTFAYTEVEYTNKIG